MPVKLSRKREPTAYGAAPQALMTMTANQCPQGEVLVSVDGSSDGTCTV